MAASTQAGAVDQKIGRSDVLVLSVSFSPAKAEFAHDVKDSGDDRTMNIVSSLFMLVQAFKKNVAKEIAGMSGGSITLSPATKASSSGLWIRPSTHAIGI